MDDAKQLKARLDLLEARARITDLVHSYAHGVRRGDVALCLSLFTADATFSVFEVDVASGTAPRLQSEVIGRDALSDFLSERVKPGEIWPLIHDLLFDIKDKTATSTCVMAGAGANGLPKFIGFYEDAFRRESDWLFTSRKFMMSRPG